MLEKKLVLGGGNQSLTRFCIDQTAECTPQNRLGGDTITILHKQPLISYRPANPIAYFDLGSVLQSKLGFLSPAIR